MQSEQQEKKWWRGDERKDSHGRLANDNKEKQCSLVIINYGWDDEKIPNVWEVGMIVSIYKKGDTKICSNCRRIILFSMSLKTEIGWHIYMYIR